MNKKILVLAHDLLGPEVAKALADRLGAQIVEKQHQQDGPRILLNHPTETVISGLEKCRKRKGKGRHKSRWPQHK